MARVSHLIGWAALAAACAASPAAVKPDEMSAGAHRQEAARERMLAEEDYARYQPRASAPIPQVPQPDGPRMYPLDLYRYNPTERAIGEAEQHLRHAREHEAAARALEQYEEADCGRLPPKVRAACPVLGPVQSVEELPDGVRIHLPPGAPRDTVLAHMRCHLAFARARGFGGVADCPLYMRGVEIAAGADAGAIELRSGDAETARQIRLRSRVTVH